jgi:hypothetical protein
LDITGATSPTLSIADLNASQHEGNYTVVVSNAFGSATSSVAQIDVNGSLTEGLVGWWKFDETDGNIAYDSSGNGNDGNLTNGPTWIDGKIGGALSFDGVDDKVVLTDQSYPTGNHASLSFWAYGGEDLPNQNQVFVSRDSLNNTLLSVHLTWVNQTGDESYVVFWYIGNSSDTNRINRSGASVDFTGSWRHWSLTKNHLTGEMIIFKDGSAFHRDSNKLQPSAEASDVEYFWVGVGYHGLLDDIRIYDRALSAVEVKALYELGEQSVQESGSGTTTVVNGTVADGSITTNQLSEQILKYLKPEITQQPIAGNIFADTDYTFSISAEGKYLTYQWKKNGVNLSGETNATLTITDANATQHDGNYSVVVSNDFGSVESGAKTLIVLNSEMDGLIGWWPLDGNTSDISGSEYHGSLSGATSSNDRFGQTNGCYYFDGVNDYINLGRPANGLNDFSFCVNLKSSQIKSYGAHGNPAIIGIRQSSGSIDDYNLATNNGILAWYDEMGTVNTFENSGKFICDNDWHLVVFSRNSDQFRFYVDGEEEHSFTGNMTPLKNEELDLGRSLWSDAIYFNGYIDDVRIYDRALSPTEVLALYQSGL